MQLLLDFTLRWNFVCFGFSLQRFHILIQMNQIYCMKVGEKSESRSCVFILYLAFDKTARKDLLMKLFNAHVIRLIISYLHLAKSTRK